jgi:hypothetical protein
MGRILRVIDQFRPGTVFIVVSASLSTGVYRAPGDLKSLAQVKFYIDQHRARYASHLTTVELVALQWLNRDGALAVATPILWTNGVVGQDDGISE